MTDQTIPGRARLVVNGRFLTRTAMSGVDRVAVQVVRALGALRSQELPELRLALALPANATDRHLEPVAAVKWASVHRGRLAGHAWEQLELPLVERDSALLSMCSIGPIARRDQLVIIHDAQVFLEPGSYSPPFRHWYRFAQPRLGRRARAIGTDSHYSLAQLERFGIAPPGKAGVIQIGSDHLSDVVEDEGALARHGLRPGGYLLALGSLAPHKNLAMLLRAAAARPPGAPELVIAGGGNPRVFGDAGLSPPPGARLLGRVTDQELKALYRHARLFAFPSITEGFGLPPLEAMAAGCPVIATTGGAVPEVCGDAVRPVDPYDQAGWTRALLELDGDAEARRDLSVRGRARASGFTWRASAISLLGLLALTPSAV